MAKYLLLWELNRDKIPDDPKARGEGWNMMIEMIKEDFNKGIHTEWGSYIGEFKGFTVSDIEPLELANNLQRFFPFVRFEVHQVLTADEVAKVATALIG